MREWKSMWKDFSPFHQGMGPCLHELFFRFIQPPSAWHPHQYLHTSSFLGLFIFLGPFCTVTKFCSTEVDGICRWYQSLLSLPVRTQDGGSEEGTGWEQEEYRAMRKAVRLLLKTVFVTLAQIFDLPGFTFSATLLVFYTNEQNFPLCSPATVTMRWRWDDPHGPSPSLGPESQGPTSDVQPAARRELGPCWESFVLWVSWNWRHQDGSRKLIVSCPVCVKSKGSRKRPAPQLPCLLTVCSLTELLSASVSTPAIWGIAPTCFIGLGSYTKTP